MTVQQLCKDLLEDGDHMRTRVEDERLRSLLFQIANSDKWQDGFTSSLKRCKRRHSRRTSPYLMTANGIKDAAHASSQDAYCYTIVEAVREVATQQYGFSALDE